MTEEEKAMYRIRIAISTPLFGRTTTIVNIEDLETVLYQIQKQQEEIENSIPRLTIEEKLKEIKTYRDLANELIEERVIIADSDSLQYGRKEAHDKDIDILQELLEGK